MNRSNILLATLLALLSLGAFAQDATIRKNLAARLPQLSNITEIRKTPLPGVYEIRINEADILYTDAQGDFIFDGALIDTRTRRNLTEERIEKLTAIAFNQLPLGDAFTVVRGNGQRKVAVFADPNCGYCKRFERDLAKVDNITVHTFLYPILSADSAEKSKNIWCAKDKGKAWQDWMFNDQVPPPANCDTTALNRNLALGRKHKITGTPTLIFVDSSRVPGAVNTEQIEKLLAAATR